MRTLLCLGFLLTLTTFLPADDLAGNLAKLNPRAIDPDSETGKNITKMLAVEAKSRLLLATLRENEAWGKVNTRADWEKFRDVRIAALKASLGEWPTPPAKLRSLTTGKHEVEGVIVENLVFESRPGLVVTATLYKPAAPPKKGMPGILIAHSHHAPRIQGELQDMGHIWAQAGCYVLVPDALGHGERRQHGFNTEKDYDKPYKTSRQDYYFRHNSGAELHLIGESLMGWIAWDLMRSVDVLLGQQGIDPEKIILLGAVAGGGDPAGVVAALDPRIKAVVPFNFGGGQPDYAIPADAERNFYWFGFPSWEGTRCLRRGAADGFAHWVITGAAAPRGLVHAHEFAWDAQRDPAWPRLQKVFGFYDAADKLASTVGKGSVKGTGPENSHCNNIGPLHRSLLYPILAKWFDMPVPKEVSQRLKPDELRALTPEAAKELGGRPLHEVAYDLATTRLAAARAAREKLPEAERLPALRKELTRVLGDSTPPAVKAPKLQAANFGARTFVVEPEPGILVPAVLIQLGSQPGERVPVVVGVAQQGKSVFLKERAKQIVALLDSGVAVCLVDVRGTGETEAAAGGRRHTSRATEFAHMEGLLGRTLLGARLRDLRTVIAALRQIDGLDPKRIVLWGESFADVNAADFNPAVPLEVDPFPTFAEPLGQMLGLLAQVYEPDVIGVQARGGLDEYRSILRSPYLYVPYDAIPPGLLTVADVPDLVKATSRPVLLRDAVNGLNQRVGKPVEQPAAERWILGRLAGR
jgi:cephalosporin-C deacetylase-like acetyl esterase